MIKKKALITGITGQDGSYLSEYLLSLGYEVHGVIRKASHFTTQRLEHLYSTVNGESESLKLHYGDVLDPLNIIELLNSIQPDEIYNLAAQSHVKVSFEIPKYTVDVVAGGAQNLLEAIRILKLPTRFYQASSSEMFGDSPPPQSEKTRFNPLSPYAAAKLHAHHTVRIYREAYGVFAVSGILFNHESPRRHETFVTRKITKAVAEIVSGKRKDLYLGNLEARRDWGYAPEYVQAMHQMLQLNSPEDFVISTGESFSIKDFLDFSFGYVNLDWQKYVKYDSALERPLEVNFLQGDSSLAKNKLDWESKTQGKALAEIMVEADIKILGI